MKRTTIFIEEHVERDLQAIARRRKQPVASLVREAVAQYVADEKRAGGATPGFVAIGRSGSSDTAERHEDLLWRDLDPHEAKRAARPPGTRARRATKRGRP